MDEPRSSGRTGLGRLVTALLPTLCAVLLIGLAFWMVAARTVALEMHTRPSVLVTNAIPVALSELYFSHPKQYMALAGVRKRFLDHLPKTFNPANIASEISSTSINPAIVKVLEMDRHRVGTELVPLGPDDKGIVDLVELSFVLFGYRAESVTIGYFALLLISCLVYVAAFWRYPIRLFPATAFLAMLYLTLPMVSYNAQLGSLLMLRAMPVLSMVACLHCLLFMANSLRERLSATQVCLAAVQVGMVVFTLHLKTSTIWQVITIVGFGLVVLFAASVRRLGLASVPWRSTALAVGVMFCLTLSGYVAVQQYQAVALKEYERHGSIATRVFWHNIFSGLAYHPTFRERYRLRIDDASIFAAMRQYLTETGRYQVWLEISGEDQERFQGMKLGPYDPLVREMLVARCSTYARECAEALLYYKPAALVGNLAWLYGLRSLPPSMEVVVPEDQTEAQSEVRNQYIEATRQMDTQAERAYLWTPLALLVVAPFVVLLAVKPHRSVWTTFAAGLALLLGSLIPTVIGYPLPHTILEPSIAVGMAVYVGLGFAAATWLRGLLAHRWALRQTPEATPPLSTASR